MSKIWRLSLPASDGRWAICLLVAHLLACAPSSQELDSSQAALTPGRLRLALQIPDAVTQSVTARLDSQSQRRDIVTEYLTLRAGDALIPAVACYSTLSNSQPQPGILLMPGSPNVKEDLMHVLDLLPAWAEDGFFVLSIDRPFHGDRPGDREQQILQRGFPAVLGDYVVDLQIALDYLSTRPQVDPQRLGMFGLSTGGLEALIVGALDSRLKVVVCASGQLSWPHVFATGAWQSIFGGLPVADSLIAEGVTGERALIVLSEAMPGLSALDAVGIVPLIAPRPLLLLGGVNDLLVPAAGARATAAAAKRAYRGAGASERFAMILEPGRGHAFSKKMQEQSFQWFQRWLY